MNIMKNIKLLFIAIVLIGTSMFGQTQKQKKAERQFDSFSFVKAIKTYEKMVDTSFNQYYAMRKLGDAYIMLRQPEKALPIYEQVVKQENVPSEYFLYYAQTLRATGNYEASKEWMKKYRDAGNKEDARVKNFFKNEDLASGIFNSVEKNTLTKVNFNFTKDVCYEALGSLEDSVKNGTPEGLKVFGDWETLYPFLGQLPPPAKKSWFDFDHYYSDQSFSEVLPLVMQCSPGLILDIGGNTGKWARLCVEQYSEVEVCVVDLPEQIVMLQEHMTGHEASSRVTGFPANMLDPDSKLPGNADVIWMSQFLDCFSEELIEKILLKCMSALPENGRLYIMETFWDKQPHEIGTLSVNATSLYFTAIANGCSRMYRQADMVKILDRTGFTVNREWDSIGVGHTLLECVKRGFVDNTA